MRARGLIVGFFLAIPTAGSAQDDCVPPVSAAGDCRASTDRCEDVLVTWEHAGDAAEMRVYRDGDRIATLPGEVREFLDTDVSPLTRYAYRIGAVRDGEEARLSDFGVGERGLPGPPLAFHVEGPCRTGDMNVTWDYAFEDPDNWEVLRRTPDTPYEVAATVPGSRRVVRVEDPSSAYTYSLRAVTSCGVGAQAPDTDPTPLVPPAGVTDLEAAQGVCSPWLRLTWTRPVVGGSYAVVIHRDGVPVRTLSSVVSHWDDYLPEPDVEHEYWIVVEYSDVCTEPVESETVTGWRAEATIPPPPREVRATRTCRDHVRVAWTPDRFWTAFRVYRDGVLLATLPSPVIEPEFFLDETAEFGVEYAYTVVGESECGDSPPSEPVLGVRTRVDAVLPAPTDLAPGGGECAPIVWGRQRLRWEPVEGAASYRIGWGATCADVEIVESDRPNLALDSSEPVTHWWVEAVDACGVVGERSVCESFTYPGAAGRVDVVDIVPHPDLPQHYIATWEELPGAERYEIELLDGCGLHSNYIGEIAADGSPFVVDLTRYDAYDVHMIVAPVTCAGESGGGSCVRVTCEPFYPDPPFDIVATQDCSELVTLTWDVIGPDEEEPDVDIYRDGALLGVSDDHAYRDFDVQPGGEYTYTLVTRNACGEASVESCPVIGRTTTDPEIVRAPVLGIPTNGSTCPFESGRRVKFTWEEMEGLNGYQWSASSIDCDTPEVTATTHAWQWNRTFWTPEPGEYHWWVQTIGPCGSLGEKSECRTIVVPPYLTAIDDVVVTLGDPNPRFFSLSWDAVPGAESYRVEVGDLACDQIARRVYTPATSASIDLTPIPGETFGARVTAIDCTGRDGPLGVCTQIQIPTPVLLEHFDVTVRPAGVTVEWRVGREMDVAGYHIDRLLAGSELSVRLTPDPIPPADEGRYSFDDGSAARGVVYVYRLSEVSSTGAELVLGEQRAVVPAVPRALALTAAPNPFNPRVTFTAALPEAGKLRLDVFDAAGRRVARLLDDAPYAAGFHEIVWEGRTDTGAPVASGAYFVRLRANGVELERRVVLLK